MKFLMSKENFIKIFYEENSKGNPLEYRFGEEVKEVRDLSEKIRKEKDKQKKKKLLTQRHEALKNKFLSIEEWVTKGANITIEEYPIKIKEKTVYCYKTDPQDEIGMYLVDKQMQRNLRSAFKIQMNSHKTIASQMICLLADKFPKYVYRTDIKRFFETIPHTALREKIIKNTRLDSFTKNTIIGILEQYKKLTDGDVGVPRGIGLSSCLAEIYMRDFDYKILDNQDIFFYARFVDDIVVFSTHDVSKYIDDNIQKINLQLNLEKTKLIKQNREKNITFEYLGYSFQLNDNNPNPQIEISKRKKEKIIQRVRNAILDYNANARKSEWKAWKLLNERLKFLTGNTRLANIKDNIFVGIYYSNPLVNHDNFLRVLDRKLKCLLHHNIVFPDIVANKEKEKEKALERLKKSYSFLDGFRKRKFYPFSSEQIKRITKVWRDLRV